MKEKLNTPLQKIMGSCASSDLILQQVKQVSDILKTVDLKADLQKIEEVLSMAWSIYEHLARPEKEHVKLLSAKYFA